MKIFRPLVLLRTVTAIIALSGCEAPQRTGHTERAHSAEPNADQRILLLRAEAEAFRAELVVVESRLIKLTNGLSMRLNRDSITRANAKRDQVYPPDQIEL